MPARKRESKGLYILKSCESELKDLAERKKSETKNLYVVRTNDEIVNKYSNVLYDFVDQPGVFILISNDKTFFHTFKLALVNGLGIEHEFIQNVPDIGRATELVQFFVEKRVRPFIFMEHSLDSELTLSFLRFVRSAYRKKGLKVAVLARELNKDRLFQFYEEGADSFLKKPTSINAIVKKIAFVLQPQTEADAMLDEARDHLDGNRFEDAIAVAEKVLRKWPKNAAAMVVLGDAKKGLKKRKEALNAYTLAERNSTNYLEPLKRIARIHAEDHNNPEAIKYLTKLDRMSPLNCNRKLKIAELYFEEGDPETAEKFFDGAIVSAKEEALAAVGEMSLDIAEMAAKYDPALAAKYYRRSLEFVKSSSVGLAMHIYNRLGISLRKQGLWQEAVEAYAEAAKHAPSDENIQYNMGLAYADGGEFDHAAERMRTALSLNPDIYRGNPDRTFTVCRIFMKSAHGKEEARELLRHLESIEPGYRGLGELRKEL